MNTPDINKLNSGNSREVCIKKHYSDFYAYLLTKYPEDISFNEKMYWYFHNINNYPTCPICGKKLKFCRPSVGYQLYCSSKCSNTDTKKQEKTKQTNLIKYGSVAPAGNEIIKRKMRSTCKERYGVDNVSQSKEIYQKNIQTRLSKYGGCGNASPISKQKYQETCKERYGTTNPMQNSEILQKVLDTNLKKYGVSCHFLREDVKNKSINTCLDRYGVEHFNNIDSIRETMKNKYGYGFNFENSEVHKKSIQTNLERYGSPRYNNPEKYKETLHKRYGTNISSPTQIPGVLEKIYKTKKINHTFNSSNIEKQFEEYLKSKNIRYKTQYKSELYPWSCDFYIIDLDLYIELQSSWTHGEHPYNEEHDKEKLDLWIEKSKTSKFYENAIKTWTVRDTTKRQIAKQNNLRYLEIFTNNINTAIEEYERFISRL